MNAECAQTALPVGDIAPAKVPRRLILIQALLGLGAYLCFCVPYMRKVFGLERLDGRRRYLFVCNHVSLLDTILLGGAVLALWQLPDPGAR